MSIMGDRQEQKVETGGVAIQAKGNVNYQEGLSAEEVRTIASLAIKSEFYQLSQMASDVAAGRAQRVCDDFLLKLEAENPEGLKQANEPDFQFALFTAQKTFARSNSDDLEKLLVDLLVQRTKEHTHDLRKIVIAESIEVLSKITNNQVNSLAIIFLITRTNNSGVRTLDNFLRYCDGHIKPFVEKMATSKATYRHLEYANCGAVGEMHHSIYSIMTQIYPGILQAGFEATDPDLLALSTNAKMLIVSSEYNYNRYQVFAANIKTLNETCAQFGISQEDTTILARLLDRPKITEDIFYTKLRTSRDYWPALLDTWNSTEMKNFNLTSVGTAIAHAAIKQHVVNFSALSIWID